VRFVVLVLALASAAPLAAHPLAPALLELREAGEGAVDVVWKLPRARPPGPAPEPLLPARCTPTTARTSAIDGTGVAIRWRVGCGVAPLAGTRIGLAHADALPSGAVVRVHFADGRVAEGIIGAARPFYDVPAAPRALDVVADYVRLGIAHILAGPDHLLFVFGLVLLAGTTRRLLATVTAFTLGHSVTLAAAVLGWVAPPAAFTEVAIAASVFVLAVELARDPARPTAIRRRPWLMAALFGLLHGLGFAAALTEAGLPQGAIPLALGAFNVGIELGQLAFVAAVLAARALLAPLTRRAPLWTQHVPIYVMGSLAAFWWLERTAGLFR